MGNCIEAHGVHKSFGSTRALDGLDLTVAAGEIHAFLGPNGAGKTTMLRILLGLIRADSGDISVLGQNPWGATAALPVAYVPGEISLWPNLTGAEVITLIGSLRGGVDIQRRDDLIDRFALDPSRICKTLSKGNRQKVALIAALAVPSDLLIFDEPTSGLDPLMESVFREVVRERRAEGTAILLSSHVLSEAESMCDRVTLIRAGKVVETGSLAQLRHLARTNIDVILEEPLDLTGLQGIHDAVVDGHHLTCAIDSEALPEVYRHLAAAGVVSLVSRPASLEEIFLRHYSSSEQ